MPALGDKAPAFKAVTTTGEINFPDDYRGKWVVLFSHPADFTPVCTSEIATFAAMRDDFHELNTELIGLSIDSNNSHLAWVRTTSGSANTTDSRSTFRSSPTSRPKSPANTAWFIRA